MEFFQSRDHRSCFQCLKFIIFFLHFTIEQISYLLLNDLERNQGLVLIIDTHGPAVAAADDRGPDPAAAAVEEAGLDVPVVDAAAAVGQDDSAAVVVGLMGAAAAAAVLVAVVVVRRLAHYAGLGKY